MASLNQCSFIGRLGSDVDTRFTNDGKAVANISIACSESWKDKNTGEKKETTEWINVSAFGKLAEIMGKYLVKGSQVYISGKMKTDKYEMVMLGGGESDRQNEQSANRANSAAQQSAPQNAPSAAPTLSDLEDIPFMSYEYKSVI